MDSKASTSLSIAIVGTGIAGETAAYLLTEFSSHSVDAIYEASSCPGLHANSVELNNHSVDVPLRAVSPHYYPNLTALYRSLSIPLQSVDYSSSGSFFNPNETFFRHNNLVVGGRAYPLPHWRDLRNPGAILRHGRIIRDVLWLVFTGPYLLRNSARCLKGKSLGTYLREYHYSYEFIHLFLYPVMSTLLSCSLSQVDEYPADYIIGFYSSRITTILTGWFRVKNGVQAVSEKLLSGVPKDRQYFNCRVQSVRSKLIRGAQKVIVTDQGGNERIFDRVIIATEPSVAKAIWADLAPSGDEAALLGSVRAYHADISLHTDATLMPSRTADWKGLNYFTKQNGDASGHFGGESPSVKQRSATPVRKGAAETHPQKTSDDDKVPKASMTTAFLNLYYPKELSGEGIFESWNPFRPPQTQHLIRTVRMVRSVWDVPGRDNFEKLLPTVQGRDGVYIAGSYAVPGVTLLEQAVTSACHVCLQLGARVPFSVRPAYESTWWTMCIAYVVYSTTYLWRLFVVLTIVSVVGWNLSTFH